MIKQKNILKMAEVRSEWCVSIYLPINNKDIDNNRIRLKNLMLEAERKLIQLNVYPLRVAKILAPIQRLLDNTAFGKIAFVLLQPTRCSKVERFL